MHVLVVPSWYPTREAPLDGIYFAEQARCLARHGLQVGVVYPEQQSLRRLSWPALKRNHFQAGWAREDGVPTLRRHGWNVWSRFPPGQRCRVRSAVRLAERYVARHGAPDLVHAQSGRWAGAAAAVSTSLRRAVVNHGLAPSSDVTIHPNLAPAAFFRAPPSARPSSPPFRLVTVARLSPQKNVGGLLDALATQTGAETTLTIVGDGPRRSELERRARALDLEDRVRFLGTLARAAVRRALWDAHALVLPSRHETFGVVLLEAMATGLPVLATASGGPEDLVTAETGLLVPPDDPEALAEGLSALRDRWPDFDAEAIRARTREQYGPTAFVRRTRGLYRRALHRGDH
ncbi:MAG: glycosyltransferase [Salinibacter sp.]